jgi:hypothetical protein
MRHLTFHHAKNEEKNTQAPDEINLQMKPTLDISLVIKTKPTEQIHLHLLV